MTKPQAPLFGKNAWKLIKGSPYVYTLADQGRVFYVGKGFGRRMTMHERDALRGVPGQKCDHIRAMREAGRQIEYTVVRICLSHEEAYAGENEVIRQHADLLNVAPAGKSIRVTPYQHLASRHQFMLDNMKPKAQWIDSLGQSQQRTINALGLTPSECYDQIRSAVQSEARAPAPTFIRVRGGQVDFCGWVR